MSAAVKIDNPLNQTWGSVGRLMETRAVYKATEADDKENKPAPQEKASTWFAKVPAAIIRDRRLTSGARDVLITLLLYANSEGVCYPRQSTIADDLGIARPEVSRRMKLLCKTGYLTMESGKSKGMQSIYHVHVVPLAVEPGQDTSQDTSEDGDKVYENITPTFDDDQEVSENHTGVSDDVTGVYENITGGVRKSGHPNITEPSNRPTQQSQSTEPEDANASSAPATQATPHAAEGAIASNGQSPQSKTSAAVNSGTAERPPLTAAPPPAKKPTTKLERQQRDLSPDHQWRVDLLARIKAANGGIQPGKHEIEWAAAGKLYAWPTGKPDLDAVVDCYTLTRASPAYDTKELSLNDIVNGKKHFAAYQRSGREAFIKGIGRSRQATTGEFDQERWRGNRNGKHETPTPAVATRDPSVPDPIERGKREIAARAAAKRAAEQQTVIAGITGANTNAPSGGS